MLTCQKTPGCMKVGDHAGNCEVQSQSEYTLLTKDIRDAYADMHCPDPMEDHSEGCRADDTFDWWFAEVERAAAARALELAADAWTQGEWSDHIPPRDAILPQILMGIARGPGDWLRARAAEIREEK